jgi:hypothetical protein
MEELSKSGDRPATDIDDEIEVTPAMIEAGYDKLMDLPELLYGCSIKEFKVTIGHAFRAMWKERVREFCKEGFCGNGKGAPRH